MGNNYTPHSHLLRHYEVSDSEDSEYGEELVKEIIDPQQKANYMSTTWQDIFKPTQII